MEVNSIAHSFFSEVLENPKLAVGDISVVESIKEPTQWIDQIVCCVKELINTTKQQYNFAN